MNEQTLSLGLLVKLGSIAVHADELTSPAAHSFDADAVRSLLADPEVAKWIAGMTENGLLPVKRHPPEPPRRESDG